MVVSAIVAASRNGVIGSHGKLPWNLPDEMAYFRKVTSGHPVIMGRVTHESIGRALPGRRNIIITSQADYQAEGCEMVCSLDEALKAAADADEVFIIGGASIYQLALPILDKIYLTRVEAEVKGDKYFNFDQKGWRPVWSERHAADERNNYAFELQVWERLK